MCFSGLEQANKDAGEVRIGQVSAIGGNGRRIHWIFGWIRGDAALHQHTRSGTL